MKPFRQSRQEQHGQSDGNRDGVGVGKLERHEIGPRRAASKSAQVV
jgi:hypothetical protein